MSKLAQICKTLGQSHPSCSEAITRALDPMHNSYLGWAFPQQHQNQGDETITGILTPVAPSAMTQRVLDPLSQVISPFVTDNEMDIFTDLSVDVDFGLTDLLT